MLALTQSSCVRLLSPGYCWNVHELRVLGSEAAEPAVVGFWVTDGAKCRKKLDRVTDWLTYLGPWGTVT